MDQKTSATSASVQQAPAKVDIMGTKLLHLLRQTTGKITELKDLVQLESELVGYSTANTIAPILEKQDQLKQNVAKCLSTIDSSFGNINTTGTGPRGRSLTVTVRDSEFRRQVAAASSVYEGPGKSTGIATGAGPSTSSSSQDLKTAATVEPIPVMAMPPPKRRSGSLERTKSFHEPTTVMLPGGVRVPARHIIDNPATEDLFEWYNSPGQTPEVSRRFDTSQMKGRNAVRKMDFGPSTMGPDSRFKSQAYGNFNKLLAKSQPGHHDDMTAHRSAAFPSTSSLFEPTRDTGRQVGNPTSGEMGSKAFAELKLLRKQENEIRAKPFYAVDLFTPMPKISSKKCPSPLFASTASLRSLAGPVQNEVTKPFETEDVEKYSTKKTSRPQSTATSSSQVSPALSSVQSDCSGSRDDEGQNMNQGGFVPQRPLRELQRNMDFFDTESTPMPSCIAVTKGPVGVATKLLEERDWALNLDSPKNPSEENEYQWDFLPDSLELRRRVNNFRFKKAGMEIHPSVAIKKLQDVELRMLLEVVSREPWLLTPEETNCLLEENDIRKGGPDPPPQLPPKSVPSTSQQKGPGSLTEAVGEEDGSEVDGAWGPVKPTLV